MTVNMAPRDLGEIINKVTRRLDNLERRGRGFSIPVVESVTTIAQDTPPSPPIVEGSLWIDTDDGNKIYRWDGAQWVPTLDPTVDLTRNRVAVEIASWQDAAASGDGLVTLYRQASAPSSGLQTGDLWVDTDDDKLYRWNGSAWADQTDTLLGQSLDHQAMASTVADGRVRTWWQNGEPTPEGFGDLWVKTSDDPDTLWRWNNFDWVQVVDWSVALQQQQLEGKISTYYATTPPTSTAVGDLWYDTDNNNQPYRAEEPGAVAVTGPGGGGWVSVQDGDITVAQATADSKNTTYYQATPPTGAVSGDLWFDTDDDNHPYVWDGDSWEDAKDPGIDLAVNDTRNLADSINETQQDLLGVIYSAQNSADTADGRISTSDYLPGADDLTYEIFNPADGTVRQVSRVEGSLWLTRTRDRRNFVTNPSIELSTTGWSAEGTGTALSRVAVTPYVDGGWALQVANGATGGDWGAGWKGGATGLPSPWVADNTATDWSGTTWTGSAYVQAVSGDNSGVYAEMVFLDSAGSRLGTVGVATKAITGNLATLTFTSAPDLWEGGQYVKVDIADAQFDGIRRVATTGADYITFWIPGDPVPDVEAAATSGVVVPFVGPVVTAPTDPPAVEGGPTWLRVSATGTAPAGTKYVYGVKVVHPHASAVWRIDGALLEKHRDLGRYFDGGSEDARWGEDGTGSPDASESFLEGGLVNALFELDDNEWVPKLWSDETISDVSAEKVTGGAGYERPAGLPANTLDGALVADGTVRPDAMLVDTVIASEPLKAGDLVNVWDNNGIYMVQKATAGADNLATNPSVEENTTGYLAGANATIGRTTAWAGDGSYALTVTPSGASTDSYAAVGADGGTMALGMKNGRTYTATATINTPVAQSGSLHATRARKIIAFYVASGVTTEVQGQQGPAVGSGTVSVTFSIPGTATAAWVRLYNGATNSATNVVYWDALTVVEADTAMLYFEGTALREAHGFVLQDAAIGELVPVHFQGYDTPQTGLIAGGQFLSSTPGKASSAPPTEPPSLVQRVGFAPNAETLNFTPAPAILLS